MKIYIFNIILILTLISSFQSQLTEEERQNLLDKVFNKKNKPELEKWIFPAKANDDEGQSLKYDPEKIKQIINKYKFPASYNFIEDVKPPVHIKNQESCGCCWAFAATTALAYRYFKKGVTVDLSPQYMLSCFSGDCDSGGYLIDTQFLLVNNGTVTETCMPFTSASGTRVEECPTRCKNGEAFVKYRAKNPYSGYYDFTFNYYDVVTIMMDQLINYGPLVTHISSYEDLSKLTGPNCKNVIYKYDGKSDYDGAHAVVIVGYGYQDSKYYWIIQNSWGEDFCDNGFAKIEFGQINIENIAFSEPYIETSEDPAKKEISVNLKLREDCRYEYTGVNNGDYDEPFEIYLKGDNGTFYYQCNKAPFLDSTKGICNYDLASFNINEKGIYKYDHYNPIFKDNTFNIQFSSNSDKQFDYYQYDTLLNVYTGIINYYISEEGSGILISSLPFSENHPNFISNIYTNNDTKKLIKNCEAIKFDEYDYIYCTISNDEISSFNQGNQNFSLVYDILCGKKVEIPLYVHQLDKSKYPVLRVNQLILPEENYLDENSAFSLMVDIEGSISGFTATKSYFVLFIEVKYKNKINQLELICIIPRLSEIQKDFELECYP